MVTGAAPCRTNYFPVLIPNENDCAGLASIDAEKKRHPTLDRLVFCVAQCFERALRAPWITRDAQGPTVIDDLMGKQNPSVLRHYFDQILFDLYRVGLPREVEPQGNALHMRVHHDAAGDSVGGSENHVGRFPRSTRDRQHLLHRPGNFASEFSHHSLGRSDDRFGFVIKEPCGPDVIGQHFRPNRREIPRCRIFSEQSGSHFIHALVGALCGEDGRHQQFPRRPVLQRAGRVRVSAVQNPEDFRETGAPVRYCFGP